MGFSTYKPTAPELPERGDESPIHEDEEEDDIERETSHVGSLPETYPQGGNHIKNSPSVDTMKILAGVDSEYNLESDG
jgi:hypothetical protein